MEQTILQLPMQPVEPLPFTGDIRIIYQHRPAILPIINQEPEREVANQLEHAMPTSQPPTQPEEALLKALAIFHYFTAEKLAEYLRYSPKTIRGVKRYLQNMEKRKLVEVANKQTRSKDEPYVYTYGREGHTHLKAIGERVEAKYRPSYERIHKAYPLAHTMAVNEVLLKAHLLEEELDYQVTLNDYRDEPELKANPLIVPIPGEEKPTKLRPDLWLDFQAATRRCFCVEVNLSRVWQRDWRQLIRAYINCVPSYQERFGTDNITIAIVVTTDADFPKKRLHEAEYSRTQRELATRFQNLLKWTEAELTEQHLEADADAFIFTRTPLLELSPPELFFSPHWVIPFDNTPRALMSLRKEADHE